LTPHPKDSKRQERSEVVQNIRKKAAQRVFKNNSEDDLTYDNYDVTNDHSTLVYNQNDISSNSRNHLSNSDSFSEKNEDVTQQIPKFYENTQETMLLHT